MPAAVPVGASAFALWRTTGRVLVPRLIVVAVTVGVVALVSSADPVWPLAAVGAGLLTIVVLEQAQLHRMPADTVELD